MTVQTVDPNLVDPNPYQLDTRQTFTPPQLADLESVATAGLIHIPVARPHPTAPGRFQMNVGWRRRAAWLLYCPGQPMPLDVRELTDAQMFEQSAIENGQRADLSAIEQATIIKRAVTDFGLTQEQAGKLVGLRTQGAANNKLRLLELPDEIKTLVAQGKLAERHARQFLSVARAKQSKALQLARDVAASGDPDAALAEGIGAFFDDDVTDMHEADFEMDWQPSTPMLIEDQLETPPACGRCDHMLRNEYDRYCARPACLAAKQAAYLREELERVSAATGIPIAGESEKAKPLKVAYDTIKIAKVLIKRVNKPDCLRLALPTDRLSSDYYHKEILESDIVLLASTDANVLTREKAAKDKADKVDKSAPAEAKTVQASVSAETPTQKQRRLEAEQKAEAERAARREAVSAQRRVMHDMAWLVFNAADVLAPQMTIQPAGLLDDLVHIHHGHTRPPMTEWPQYRARFDELAKQVKGADTKSHMLLSCKLLIARELGNNMSAYRAEEQFDWPGALQNVRDLAGEWGLKLPAGWDMPPIHRTDHNCYVCGKFTSTDHVTKVDEANGWAADETGVTCDHKCRKDKDDAALKAAGIKFVREDSQPAKLARKAKLPAKKTRKGGKANS